MDKLLIRFDCGNCGKSFVCVNVYEIGDLFYRLQEHNEYNHSGVSHHSPHVRFYVESPTRKEE